MGHMVSVAMTSLCCCGTKTTIHNTLKKWAGLGSNEMLVTKTGSGVNLVC